MILKMWKTDRCRIKPWLSKGLFLFAMISIVVVSCDKPQKAVYQKSSFSRKGMVVTASIEATKVGNTILRQGGTAYDAAIASYFTLAVTYPRAGNIGGGGFAVIRDNNGQVRSLDFREVAPASAYRDMYLDSTGQVVNGLSVDGVLSIGIPGSVHGMYELYQSYETHFSWQELLAPAIELANRGFSISKHEAGRLNAYREDFIRQNGQDFPFVKAVNWSEGDTLKQPALAETLELIARDSFRAFYEGEIAASIVTRVKEGDGIIETADLARYRAKWRKPISIPYKQFTVHSMGPPSSGGIVMGQILKMVEPYALNDDGILHPYNVHLVSEASKRAFHDRMTLIGDSDFTRVEPEALLSVNYLNQKMSDYQAQKATPIESFASDVLFEARETYETTHFSIVDIHGNAVSITTTLNGNYGSKVFVHDRGFFLNNQMDDFSIKPGHPNQFGLIGSEANAIEPGKRMLSSMAPTIIEKGGQLFMVLGSPGGPTIISSVLQVFLSVGELGLPLGEAIALGRFHHQFFPDEILMENIAQSTSLIENLEGKGHRVRVIDRIGSIAAIHRHESGTLEGGADPRDASHAQGL